MTGRFDNDDSLNFLIPTNYFVPISEYSWESGGGVDYSLDNYLSFYMPASDLINDLKLSRSQEDFSMWVNKEGKEIFYDPSLAEQGPSSALIDKNTLLAWLEEHDLEILWLVGGEKQLAMLSNLYGCLIYNGLYRIEGGELKGSCWFERWQRPL